MYEIVQEIVNLFGLNYQPTTFGDLFVWFVLVMSGVCMVCGMIRIMFFVALNTRRLAE